MPNKCISSGLYLTARSAYQVKENLHERALLIDVRTAEEAAFKGVATSIDALVPLKRIAHPYQTDTAKGTLKMVDNAQFVAQVDRLLAAKKGQRDNTPVLVMCGGGWRSAEAAQKLIDAGYGRVYNVVDGLDGDFGPDGKRDVNGWKKAGLPWNFWVDRSKLYIAAEDERS
jgi:rhodanese-related sulfurtransferase